MTTTRPVALVTGASSGIGKAAALALVAAGFEVVGTSRNTSRVTRSHGVTFLDLDVASDDSVAAAVEQVIERFGRIDVLVNNAGIGSAGAPRKTPSRRPRALFDINVFGVMRMTKAVLPHMRAQGQRAHHQHLVRPRVPPRSPTWPSTPRPSTRSRGTPSPWTTRSANTASGPSSSSRPAPIPRSRRTASGPTCPLQVYAEQRHIFDDMWRWRSRTATTPPSSPRRSSRPPPTPSRSCATPPARAGRVSALRRIVPAGVFDRQIRKINRLAG